MSIKSIIKTVFLMSVLNVFSISILADPFDKGNTTATFALGSGKTLNENYLIIGAGIGYYIKDGIEVGVEVDYWSGGDPSIYEITPKLSYVYDNASQLKPYLGVFYNRTFIEGLDNSDAVGYRAGVLMYSSRNAYLGAGIVHKELQDCTNTLFLKCSETYSEISIIFSL